MRPPRTCKLLAKLTLLVAGLGLALYCLLVFGQVSSSSSSSSTFELLGNSSHNASSNPTSSGPPGQLVLEAKRSKDRNIWCIFTKVTSNSPMRRKFRIFVESLLRHSAGARIVFHVITDDDSRIIAEKVVEYNVLVTKKTMKVQYYNVHKSAAAIEDIISAMSPHFSSKPGTYYSDALFFLSLGLHKIAAEEQDVAVMVDADTKFRVDVDGLFREFDKFGKDALFGLAPELTPVYRHVLYIYRSKNPKTSYGEPQYLGGYPGYNSGIILVNLKRLRESLEYEQIVGRDSVEHMVEKYEFKGHLGDQDFYTLLGMERPELIHTIDCGWNRQLCTWWRDRGYADVFANYSRCNSETKLWHGNCNTPIPES